jgi:hypothetical protein
VEAEIGGAMIAVPPIPVPLAATSSQPKSPNGFEFQKPRNCAADAVPGARVCPAAPWEENK